MFIKSFITLLVFIFSSNLYAVSPKDLKEIYNMQNQALETYECEAHWQTFLGGKPYQQLIVIDENTSVVLLPCSHWAINFVSNAYLVTRISESYTEYVRLQFLHDSPLSDQYYTSDLHNLRYYNGEIYTQMLVNSFSNCGTLAKYTFDTVERRYKPSQIKVFEDCM